MKISALHKQLNACYLIITALKWPLTPVGKVVFFNLHLAVNSMSINIIKISIAMTAYTKALPGNRFSSREHEMLKVGYYPNSPL